MDVKKNSQRKLDDEQADWAAQQCRASESVRHLAEELGVSNTTLRRYLDEREVTRSQRTAPKLLPAQRRSIRGLYEGGVSIRQVANRAGVRYSTVKQHLSQQRTAIRSPEEAHQLRRRLDSPDYLPPTPPPRHRARRR